MPSLSKYDTRSQMALDIPLCALFDIYEPMLHASLSFSWLSYLEVEGSSWICGSVHVEAVGESTFSVKAPQIDGTITFLLNLIERFFLTGC